MKRLIVTTLILALGAFTPGSADAFGGFMKNMGKRRAKQEAKRRAKEEAKKKVAEATGVDIEGIASGDAAGMAKGHLKAQAKQQVMNQVMGATGLPPELAMYEGMNKNQVRDALQAKAYEERGLTKFSPMTKRRAADRVANGQLDGIWAKIEKAKAMKAAIGAGGVGGVGAALGAVGGGGVPAGDGSVESFVAGHSALERAVGSPTTTQDLIDGVATGEHTTGDPREAAIRAQVWAELGTSPAASTRFQRIKAAAMISSEMKKAGIR